MKPGIQIPGFLFFEISGLKSRYNPLGFFEGISRFF